MENPYSCSRPQPATGNGVRDGSSNWLVTPRHPHEQYPLWASCIVQIGAAQPRPGFDLATLQPSACEATTLPMRLLRVYIGGYCVSGYCVNRLRIIDECACTVARLRTIWWMCLYSCRLRTIWWMCMYRCPAKNNMMNVLVPLLS